MRSKIKEHHNISVMQHGYSHNNYANVGEPLNEFGQHRNLETQLKEIRIEFEKLITSFGNQFVPVFVPPWGHIAESVIEKLSTIGIEGISLIGHSDKNYPNLFFYISCIYKHEPIILFKLSHQETSVISNLLSNLASKY